MRDAEDAADNFPQNLRSAIQAEVDNFSNPQHTLHVGDDIREAGTLNRADGTRVSYLQLESRAVICHTFIAEALNDEYADAA